jgi:hypothetical protein
MPPTSACRTVTRPPRCLHRGNQRTISPAEHAMIFRHAPGLTLPSRWATSAARPASQVAHPARPTVYGRSVPDPVAGLPARRVRQRVSGEGRSTSRARSSPNVVAA